ncbi:TonB-dependent receptor [Flavisphingomonas formosensis]|uniref:TonB-dependent receptor n=1 Tax=Flavisphingomonas formosensis TaxID=861534 RepID=UPI0018DFE8B5|nr:TonB-dependent receptor [Sphingomonas formosensis]
MRRRLHGASMTKFMACGSVIAFTAFAAFPAFAQSGAPQQGLEDIVVTAQKREESLQKVPISITAVSTATIQNARITNVRNLTSIAPNLYVTQQGGGSQIPAYSIRGVLAANASPGADNGVSLYVDGVYIARINGSLFDMADIARIEVLKGPQGTVFGRNATGGAISIITHDPTGKFGIRQELSAGNYRQFRSKTRIDLPAFGPFAATVSYFHDQRRGDIRNLGAGTTWDYSTNTNGQFKTVTSPKYLGSTNTDGVQAKLKFDNDGPITATYKFDYTDQHYTSLGVSVLGFGTAYSGLLGLLYSSQPSSSVLGPITGKRPKAVNNWYAAPGHVKNWGHTFTANWRVSDVVTLKNIFAYRKNTTDDYTQIDGAGGLVATAPFLTALGVPAAAQPYLIGSPFTILGVNVYGQEHTWSDELQLNITNDFFSVTSGLYYFQQSVDTGGHGVKQIPSFQFSPGFVVPGPIVPPSTLRAKSYAAYLQATFHLTDQLDFVGGGRITKDIKNGTDVTGGVDPSTGAFPTFSYRNSKPTWLVGLNYQATPNILTYVKASTGFISGGRLGGLSYEPESAQSYEGGIKADLLNRRLRANLAGFYVDYTNLQFPFLGSTGGLGYLNAGKSRAWGGELELTYLPVNGLTLQANLGYTNFKYTEVAPSVLAGRPLSQFYPSIRPKVTASGVVQYESEPIVFGARLLARVEGNYRSKYYLNQAIPSAAEQAANPQTARLAGFLVSPATFLLNGRLGLTEIPIANTKAQIALWGRNLTNRKEITHVSNLTVIYSGSYEPARTYGIDFNFEF